MTGGLIFDLDGTLWDSSAACAAGWNRAVEAAGVGKPVDAAMVRGVMGLPHGKVFERTFPEVEPPSRDALAEACYTHELEAIRETPPGVYPGVMPGLTALAERYPLFIVSNCLVDYLDTFFELTGLRPLFTDALCHGHTGKAKGANLRALVEKHRLRGAAYIGDTAGDQNAAREAGLAYYHVEYGFGQPDRECLTFRDFPELVAFFLQTGC